MSSYAVAAAVYFSIPAICMLLDWVMNPDAWKLPKRYKVHEIAWALVLIMFCWPWLAFDDLARWAKRRRKKARK